MAGTELVTALQVGGGALLALASGLVLWMVSLAERAEQASEPPRPAQIQRTAAVDQAAEPAGLRRAA